MSDAIIVGLMSVGGSIIVQCIISHAKARETNTNIAVHEQKQEDAINNINQQLAEVKRRLDSHNGYAEKFAKNTKDMALMQKDIEFIKKQVESIKICRQQ